MASFSRHFSDPTEEGMWIFDAKVAKLRKSNILVVKIESHPDSDVSGRREGKVLIDPNPPTHPLLKYTLAQVKVAFTRRKELRVESLLVKNLRVPKPRVKARHVVIHGDRVGEVVVYIRSDGLNAQVHKEDASQDVFYVAKSQICVIESQ